MRATDFEFRHCFWFILLLFWAFEGRSFLWVVLTGFAIYLGMLAVLRRRRARA